jgi:hypothetical protein
MSEAYSTHGRDYEYIRKLLEKPEKRDQLRDLGVDGRIILK